ncbi:MAG: S1 RNA-binding domain-containing protein [Clostridiales bacterium]|nr:S1 RNA-binding domain-containing protein [Clostridiales bacterium]
MTEEVVEKENVQQETMEDYSKELEASFRKIREGEIISGTVIAVDEEEVVLDLNYYAQGIIKAEDMSSDPKFNILDEVKIGSVIEATVVKTDDGAGNIQLSCKEAKDILSWDILKKYMEEEKEISVKVSEVVNGGVIAYAEGIRGFIPASQLSLIYVEDLEPWMNKQLTVRVITVDEEKKKLVLSAKVLEKQKAEAQINHKISMLVPGTVLEGTVESLMPYGVFIALADGLSGLVHISQISVKRIKKPSEVLTVGDKVKVKILNTNDNKISLSIKAVEEDSKPDEMEEKEAAEYSSNEEIGTSLGDLFKKLKLQ